MSDLQKVMRRVTPWQATVIAQASEAKGGKFWTPYNVRDVTLARGGTLTPLGEEVRAHVRQFFADSLATNDALLHAIEKQRRDA